MAEEAGKLNWFVVHTYSGHERKVNDALKQRIESLGLKEEIQDIFKNTAKTKRVP